MKFVTAVCLSLILISACSDDEGPSNPSVGPDATVDAAAAPDSAVDAAGEDLATVADLTPSPDTSEPSCPAATSEVIVFETEDGVELEADLHTTGSAGSPAVVLLHMIPPSNDRSNYPLSFREQLNEAGFTVLNVDRRGAGGSGGQAADAYLGPNGKLDAAAAVSALAALPCPPDLARLAIIGASNGTTTALDYTLHVALSGDEITVPRALVFLTGGSYTENQNPVSALLETSGLEALSILFLYPQDEATWSEGFKSGSANWTHSAYEESGHGTQLFDSAPSAMAEVTEWLTSRL